MALRTIREFGDEVLNKECKEVTKMTLRTKVLINDMLDTMYEAMGVGLAAPQVRRRRMLKPSWKSRNRDKTELCESKSIE